MLHTSLVVRNWKECAAAAFLLGAVSCASAEPLQVVSRGSVTLPPSTTDQNGASFTIAGLSGISQVAGEGDAVHQHFLAVMDNSNKLVKLEVTFGKDGSIAAVHVTGGISIVPSLDFEGIVATSAERGTVFLSEETTPGVVEVRLSDGQVLRTLPLPPVFATRRPNFGLESLTALWTDAREGVLKGTLWTANEEALTVDGNPSTSSAGTVVRLQSFSMTGGGAVQAGQVAYITEPLHGAAISGSRSGLADMVLLPDGRLIALERSFAFSTSGFFRTRIFELSLEGVSDISSIPGLIGQSYTPISTANGHKRLLWTGDLSNVEGLAVGGKLASGSFPLVGIVDDGDPISVNRLVAFELRGVGGAGESPLRQWPRR